MKVRFLSIYFVVCFTFVSSLQLLAQAPEKSQGIKLFDKGDIAGAIELLKKSDDLVDLNYLGYAYEKLGKEKDARNAFDRSFRNGYKEFAEEIISRSAFDLKQSTPVDKLSIFLQRSPERIVIAALSARRSLELKGPSSKEAEWTMKARMFGEIGRILVSNQMIYSSRELDTDAKIISKPRPGYTDLARMNNTQGTIELLVLLDSDGTVKGAIATRPLPNGLTLQSYIAASKITFTPAQKAGKPVATLKAMSYSFTIY